MMPGYNRTGPMGNAPMTGRGMGFCNNTDPGDERQYPGAGGLGRGLRRQRGIKRGFGSNMRGSRGRGFARRRPSGSEGIRPLETTGEIETLKMQAESMKNTLDAIQQRMQELEKTND
jgi:hypothetical protein